MNGIHHLICVNLCPAQKFLLFINYYPVVKKYLYFDITGCENKFG